MLTPKRGDTLVRITPPSGGRDGYSQAGTVDRVDEETIDLIVQVDIPRRMRFRRADGFDTVGLGTFVVRPDSVSAAEEIERLRECVLRLEAANEDASKAVLKERERCVRHINDLRRRLTGATAKALASDCAVRVTSGA